MSSCVANSEAMELGEPGRRPLDGSSVAPQPLAALYSAPGDAGLDTTTAQRLTTAALVVSLANVQFSQSFTQRPPA